MARPLDEAARAEPEEREEPSIEDLARGANGLGEPADPQEIAQGLIAAQVEAMNSMVSASMNMTNATLKAMTQFWGLGQTKPRDDDS